MTLTQEAPVWGRVRGVYGARLTAHIPGGIQVPLGEHRTSSPHLTLRWLRGRAQDLADQLAAPYAHPLQVWASDKEEQNWALDYVMSGEPYLFWVTDEDGIRYVFLAQSVDSMPLFPSARSTHGNRLMQLRIVPGLRSRVFS